MPGQGNCQNGMQAFGNESCSSKEKSDSESLFNLFYVKYFHEDVCNKHCSNTHGCPSTALSKHFAFSGYDELSVVSNLTKS